jgi:hypothetical protein
MERIHDEIAANRAPEPGPPHPVPLPHTTGARELELPVIPSPLPYKGEGQGEGYPACRTVVHGESRMICASRSPFFSFCSGLTTGVSVGRSDTPSVPLERLTMIMPDLLAPMRTLWQPGR